MCIFNNFLSYFISYNSNKKESYFINYILIFNIFLLSFASFASNDCEIAFENSKLHYSNKSQKNAVEAEKIFPTGVDPIHDRQLQTKWNEKANVAPLLNVLFPKDVNFIKRQQYQADSVAAVKTEEYGESLIARAHYTFNNISLATRVVFSKQVLVENLRNKFKKNWLVRENATAAILHLHGGGTNSTGAHVASNLLTHFSKYNIDVLSLDLPWHGEGHREYFTLENDIKTLQRFVQKFIPPNVPLFIWGHSWGALFAEQIMRMSDRPHEEFLFHKNLKGVMIMSGVTDPAPGGSVKQKHKNMVKRRESVTEEVLQEQAAKAEINIQEKMLRDGKINPLGGYYLNGTILHFDQTIPKHKGKDYIPGLVVVGKGDGIVYLGNEDLFKTAYEPLQNIETHLLDKLPLLILDKSHNNNKTQLHKVGHLLGDYTTENGEVIDIHLAKKFIMKQLGLTELKKRRRDADAMSSFISIIQLAANDLSFREFLKDSTLYIQKQSGYGALIREKKELFVKLSEHLSLYHSPNKRVKTFLASINNLDLKNLKKEATYIIDNELFNSLSNKPIITEVLEILNRIQTVKEGDKKELESINRDTKKLLSNNFFKLMNGKTSRKKSTTLEKNILYLNKTKEEIIKIIKEEQLPDPAIEKDIIKLIPQYIVLRDLGNIFQDPTLVLNKLKNILHNHDVSEVFKRQLGRLEYILHKIKTLSDKQAEQKEKRDSLRKQYFLKMNIVIPQIKLIKIGLENLITSTTYNDSTLMINLKELNKEFALVQKEYVTMEKVLETIYINNSKDFQDSTEVLNTSKIDNILLEHKKRMEKFTNKFILYREKEDIFKKNAIIAMEKGQLGSHLQEAVISLYGPNSKGNMPTLGIDSSYHRYLQVIEKLAAIESKMYKTSMLQKEREIEYHVLIQEFVKMPELTKDKKTMLLLDKLHKSLDYINIVHIDRILEGKYNDYINLKPNLMNKKNREEIKNYLLDNQGIFMTILQQWHALQSTAPLSLPTKN